MKIAVNWKGCGYIQANCTCTNTCWKGNRKIQKIQNISFYYSNFLSWLLKWNNGHYMWSNKFKCQCWCGITYWTHVLNWTYIRLFVRRAVSVLLHSIKVTCQPGAGLPNTWKLTKSSPRKNACGNTMTWKLKTFLNSAGIYPIKVKLNSKDTNDLHSIAQVYFLLTLNMFHNLF